jgi:hypothetical protein
MLPAVQIRRNLAGNKDFVSKYRDLHAVFYLPSLQPNFVLPLPLPRPSLHPWPLAA